MNDKKWVIFNAAGKFITQHVNREDAEDAMGICRQVGIEGCTLRQAAIGDTDEAYSRGWRDAVAAAVALVDERTAGDDLLAGLGREVAALTPPG